MVVIDRATDGDLPALLALLELMTAQHESYDPFNARGDNWPERARLYLKERLSGADCYLAVARCEHEVVGLVSASVSDAPLFAEARRGVIENLAVAPAWRRQGLGTRLMQAALAWCAGAGATRAQLAVAWTNDDGRRFWERCGFAPVFVWLQRPTH